MSNRSNKDLAEEALALGALLRIEVKLEGLKNPALVELVAELNGKLPPLPADHQRPTVEEFVSRGYKAENYESHMAAWENEIRRKIAAESAAAISAPPVPPVDGADTGTAGGPPVARPLDPPPARTPPGSPTVRVDGAQDDTTLGGPPKDAKQAPLGALRYPFTVAEGKSLTCKRGTLGAFQPVSAEDFSGGKAQLEELVARGYVTSNVAKP